MINFPPNPSKGNTHTDLNSVIWICNLSVADGDADNSWARQGKELVKVISNTAPTDTFTGLVWFDSSSGLDYTWYEDSDSGQWVQNTALGASNEIPDGSIETRSLADNSVTPAKLAAPLSNRNLIMNSNFLINQRGSSSYSLSEFTADRWFQPLSGITTSPLSNGDYPQINISGATGAQLILRQPIELLSKGKPGYFAQGETFTLSFKIFPTVACDAMFRVDFADNSSNSNNQAILNFTTVPDLVINEWNEISHTFTVGTDPIANSSCVNVTLGGYLGTNFDAGDIVALADVQLERGSEKTPIEPIIQAVEKMKCQRYGIASGSNNTVDRPVFVARYASATQVIFLIPLPVNLRTDPVLSGACEFTIAGESTSFTLSQDDINSLIANPFGINARLDGLTGVSTNGVYTVRMVNHSSIFFEAEL